MQRGVDAVGCGVKAQPLEQGHAIWCAREIVGDELFAIFLPDEFMVGSPGCMKQMVDAYSCISWTADSSTSNEIEEQTFKTALELGRATAIGA